MGKRKNVCKVSQLGDLIGMLSGFAMSTPISPISVDWDDDGILLFNRIPPNSAELAEEMKMTVREISETIEELGTVQNRIESISGALGLGGINE